MSYMCLRFILWGRSHGTCNRQVLWTQLVCWNIWWFCPPLFPLSLESPALPTALCWVAGLSINLLEWWAVSSAVWSFGLQNVCLLYFLLKLPHGSMFCSIPSFHGHILRWFLHSRAVLLFHSQVSLYDLAVPTFQTIYSSVFVIWRPSRRRRRVCLLTSAVREGLHMSSEPGIILRLTEYNFQFKILSTKMVWIRDRCNSN